MTRLLIESISTNPLGLRKEIYTVKNSDKQSRPGKWSPTWNPIRLEVKDWAVCAGKCSEFCYHLSPGITPHASLCSIHFGCRGETGLYHLHFINLPCWGAHSGYCLLNPSCHPDVWVGCFFIQSYLSLIPVNFSHRSRVQSSLWSKSVPSFWNILYF